MPAPVAAAKQTPAPVSAPAALPPVPFVDGPLAIHVQAPARNATLPRLDSTFVFGSVGSGAATLRINGTPVPVQPNGAFLAFLPMPRGDAPSYELVAEKRGETATLTLPVRFAPPPMPLPEEGRLVVDAASVVPKGELMLRGDEPVRVALRAPENATVTLRTADGESHAMHRANGAAFSVEVPARELEHPGTIVARRGHDSVVVQTAAVTLSDRGPRRWAELVAPADAEGSDTDQVVILRPVPNGTYKWFLLPGTTVEVTGQRGDAVRVRLDSQLEAWTGEHEVRHLAEGRAPHRVAGNARVTTADGWSDLRIPMAERPPFEVSESRDALVLTLYGTVANTDIVNLATADPVIRDVTWEQVASDRARFTVHLRAAPYGYLVFWNRGALVLRVRHAPRVSRARPLEGRVIVVDAGHPPAGSTGPTGLYEGDAVLMVAERLKPLLEARGATVVMTRTTRAPVALGERPVIARRANADAFVSIHLNALPDGVNPYRAQGSGTYFFHDQSEPLARAIERGLARQIGMRDLGINYDNLAVVRATWFPAVLCEGAFVIIPEVEAALRNSEFQQRYATGILEGLDEYFRSLADH
ncbi:MAG: N-acetylmuramoyl-L-alanine amidase [Gemmatimonadetes bacterium]|nr:N-acetylmuramoyl-L-alanine amidase [Gemmatimonadota bacterium]